MSYTVYKCTACGHEKRTEGPNILDKPCEQRECSGRYRIFGTREDRRDR